MVNCCACWSCVKLLCSIFLCIVINVGASEEFEGRYYQNQNNRQKIQEIGTIIRRQDNMHGHEMHAGPPESSTEPEHESEHHNSVMSSSSLTPEENEDAAKRGSAFLIVISTLLIGLLLIPFTIQLISYPIGWYAIMSYDRPLIDKYVAEVHQNSERAALFNSCNDNWLNSISCSLAQGVKNKSHN